MPFILTITTYEDDYKHRYDNGVYPETPKLFRTNKAAQKYLCECIANVIEQDICDYDKIDEAEKQYFNIVMKTNSEGESYIADVSIKDKYKYDLDVLDNLRISHCKGEFVEYTWDYNLHQIDFEKSKKKAIKSQSIRDLKGIRNETEPLFDSV